MTAVHVPSPSVVVTVPARNEQDRIEACLHALAIQRDVDPQSVLVLLVLDGCVDQTEAVARRTAAAHPALRLNVVQGPATSVGAARATGWRIARALVDDTAPLALLASTDADTRVDADWIAAQRAAVAQGALAIGGVIELDEAEAALLPRAALMARDGRVARRQAVVRHHVADAEHHQFSGASLSLTPAAYDRVGGLPEVDSLEDEALEAELRRHGIPIAYLRAVRVTTSARLDVRVPGAGLAFALRAALPA